MTAKEVYKKFLNDGKLVPAPQNEHEHLFMAGYAAGQAKTQFMRDLNSVEQQLAAREKQIVMMREALTVSEEFIDRHSESWYVSGQNDLALVRAALNATDDLSGLILCDANPVAYETYKGCLLHAEDPRVMEHSEPEPLYRARLLKRVATEFFDDPGEQLLAVAGMLRKGE